MHIEQEGETAESQGLKWRKKGKIATETTQHCPINVADDL